MILPMRRAFRGLREHTYLAMVNAGVICAALVLLGVYGLVVTNLEAIVNGWQQDVHVSAYFDANVTADEQTVALTALAARPEVATVELVTSDMAAVWMRDRMPELGPVLDELGSSTLPASLELKLKPGHRTIADMDQLAVFLNQTAKFSAVDYGREWVEKAAGFVRTLTLLGFVLGAILAGSALFLVGNTIHLVVYARRDELEILRLVGATDGYIVAPFLIEGALEGIVGSGLAYLVVDLVHRGIRGTLADAAPLLFGDGGVQFLPSSLLLGLGSAAVVTGVVAAWVAVRRFLAALP